LKIKNEWLESQQPERLAEDRIKKENKFKEELLKVKGNILRVLDLSQINTHEHS
jgi:hypothetical protein